MSAWVCPVCGAEAMRFNVSHDESKLVCDTCLYEAWGLPPIPADAGPSAPKEPA